jgi:DNA replication and repair protein RecF
VWVHDLQLTDFRSYAELSVTLEPGVTTFIGRNGQGKTNLVEAIGYCATLGSHRVAADAPLVRFGAEQAIIHCGVHDELRNTAIDILIHPGRANKARINGVGTPRTRDILGIVRTVLFAPEDLAIVKGDPTDRRRFLDDIVVQQRPAIAGIRADYERVLKQRNTLLKTARGVRNKESLLTTLDSWDAQLANLGGQIIAERCAFVAALNPHFAAQYSAIADGMSANIRYRSAVCDDADMDAARWEQILLAAMAERRSDEIDRGVTLAGPQRDDLTITLGEHPAKGFASHGESWSLALALRLAAHKVLAEDGDAPILILDDVFAELDTKRREHLVDAFDGTEQVLITAAVAADIPDRVTGARFEVAGGTVRAQ